LFNSNIIDLENLKGDNKFSRSLNSGHIKSLKIPLPSLDVQRQIVEEFENVENEIQRVLKSVEELRSDIKSKFIEMFGDPVENPNGWEMRQLGDCGSFKNGLNYSHRDSGFSIKCLGVGDFGGLYKIDDMSKISKISLSVKPSSDYLLQDGDIVFVRSNGNKELVGRSVEVFPGEEELTFSGFCIRYRNESPDLLTVYLNHALHLPTLRTALLRHSSGANIKNLNQQVLSTLSIVIPPFGIQTRFASFVRDRERLKFKLQRTLNELETVKSTLLDRYL
jgi:type I restriction enzyme S subunit